MGFYVFEYDSISFLEEKRKFSLDIHSVMILRASCPFSDGVESFLKKSVSSVRIGRAYRDGKAVV